jgi:uncharacterized protein YbjT (DUF2867 family)
MALAATVAAPASAQEVKPKDGGVIVFGGAGRLGVDLIKELLKKGESVTAFVRPTTDRTPLKGMAVAYAVGDARNAEDVNKAFAAAKYRVAINALARRDMTEVNFWDRTQMNITAAAKATGVKEVIFLSSVGVGDSAGAYSPEAYARSKVGLLERGTAEEDLKKSGLDWVIIRTGAIIEPTTPATGKGRLTEDRTVLGPITRADLATVTVDCIGNAQCRNKTFHATDDTLKIPDRRR